MYIYIYIFNREPDRHGNSIQGCSECEPGIEPRVSFLATHKFSQKPHFDLSLFTPLKVETKTEPALASELDAFNLTGVLTGNIQAPDSVKCWFLSGYVLRRPEVFVPTWLPFENLLIGWVTHEKLLWKVSQLLLVVLILETLNMTPGQLFKLLHSGVPLSIYSDKLVIIVWFIVSVAFLLASPKLHRWKSNLLRSWWFVGIV